MDYIIDGIANCKNTLYGVISELEKQNIYQDTTWATNNMSDVKSGISDEDLLSFIHEGWPENPKQWTADKFYNKRNEKSIGDWAIIKFMKDHSGEGAIASHDADLLEMARYMNFKRYCLKSIIHNFHIFYTLSFDNKSDFLFMPENSDHFWKSFSQDKKCQQQCDPSRLECITLRNPPSIKDPSFRFLNKTIK
tara:strand:+ start:473 stop:1051 length:579 start_codon:yes stop_codon:yes gene_type:complete